MHFTKEETQEAKDVNLVELLTRLGVALKRHGNEYKHAEHDSLKISEYKGWKWHSQEKKGNAVDYLMNGPDFNYNFIQAVEIIRSVMRIDKNKSEVCVASSVEKCNTTKDKSDRKKELLLPEKHSDNKRISAYLNRTRGIDYEFINRCIKNGSLYESADRHNAVFVGRDFEGKERYACQRGTGYVRFTGDVGGADKSYNFRIDGSSKTLRVFESPIDLLSYLTLAKMKEYKCNDTLFSLGSVSLDALDTYISESAREVNTIAVCTDNDAAGKGCFNEIYLQYADKYKIVDNRPKDLVKDYNEMLVKELKLEKGLAR